MTASSSYPSIIIGRKGSVGAVTYAPNGGWPIDTTFYVEVFDPKRLDLRYLFYALRRARLDQHTITTSIPGVNRDDIYRTMIPLPPPAGQHRIAAILDKADAIRQKRRNAIRLSEQFLRSAFLEMFGNPLVNPRNWTVRALSDIARVQRGKFTPRPRNDPSYYGGAYPFIQTGEINSTNGYLRHWKQTLNEKGTRVSRSFDEGTVVIAIVGATIGATAILGRTLYCPDSVIGIRAVSDSATPEYIEYVLRFWKPIFLSRAPETARANINLETLLPLQIPVPLLKDQERFSTIYRRVLDGVVQRPLLEDDLFESLVQSAFRGELISTAIVPSRTSADGNATETETVREAKHKPRARARARTTVNAKRKEPKGINFKRGAIASYVIARLHNKPTFGRTQLEKLCYLTQTHLGIDLAMEFKREAAGPFDEVIHKVESLARKQGWFTAHKRKDFGHHYRPGPKINSRVGAAVAILGDQRDSMDSLLDLFARMKTEQAELFATVYAAWNDLLLAGAKPTDADIAGEVRNNWHESKKRFTTDRIQTWIDWIREQNLAPTGTGIRTEAC